MNARLSFRLLLPAFALVALAACGGDDGGPSPTDTGASTSASATERPTANPSGQADFVAVFASPEGTHAALAALAERTDVPLLVLSNASRDPASFADIAVPDGMQITGTTPVSTARESADFDAEYLARTGEDATDAARQAYDAVYVVALAAIGVNATTGDALTQATVFVANPPGEIVGPGDFAHAKELAFGGQELNYTGISGFVDITDANQMSKGAEEVWRYVAGEMLPIETRDIDALAELGAGVPTGALVRTGEPQEGGSLVLGVLSATDDNGGPIDPVGVGAAIAVDEINAADGVFGLPVEVVFEAPGEGAGQALLDGGANAIVGPTDQQQLLDAAGAAEASGVPVYAFIAEGRPAGASVFNLAPSDALQAPVLANLAIEQGKQVACVLYEGGAGPGQALAEAFQAALEHKQGRVRDIEAFSAGDEFGEIVNKCLSG